MRFKCLPLALGLAAVALTALAADKGEEAVKLKLAKQFPDVKITSIRPTPVSGMFEVAIGGDIGYVTQDGKYLIQGDLIELSNQKNLTEVRREGHRKQVIDALGEKNMIVFSPKKPTHTITVFTDIDCGYCRLLHKQIEGYEKQGIAVRYLFFPRAGLKSESAQKADAVWCAKNRQEAMTKAKAGENLPAGKCKTPIATHYQAAVDLGVRGTPAIVTEAGRLIAGYMPPENLKKELTNPEP